MNGVDIASYQADLDPYALDGDFIIIKVSQGTGYENPTWRSQADATLGSGKLLGLYHYAAGSDATSEADYFLDLAADYVGRALLCLDWESGDNAAFGDASWCEVFLGRVVERTGTTPMLYGGQHVLYDNPSWPHWIAQYPDYTPTGYQDHPWNEGAYDCEIRQYSSVGDIDGYNGNLDLDKAYIDKEQWLAYIGGEDMAITDEDIARIVDANWRYVLNGTDGTYNADAGRRLVTCDEKTQTIMDQTAQITALTAAVNALATASGADPQAIIDAVNSAVTEKLESLRVSFE